MSDQDVRPTSQLGRRQLIKLGAGVVAGAVAASNASAQGGGQGAARGPAPPVGSGRPPGPRPHTGPGYYVNDYDRLDGNGPMDDATRRIVDFARNTTTRT